MSVRLTSHRGRAHTTSSGAKIVYSAKHNDREFDSPDYDKHIDWDRTIHNQYYDALSNEWISHKDKNSTFADVEKQVYSLLYQKGVDSTNEIYIRQGHKDRCKTIDDLLKNSKTAPEEVIWQIGNKGQGIVDLTPEKASELLKDVWQEFMDWHMEKYPQIGFIDVGIHVDEATPHIHSRQTYFAYDDPADKEHSLIRCKQEVCLEQMGVNLPDPSKKRSRFNNRKLTYTKDCRDKMIELCRERGFEIEERPLEASKVGKDLAQWQREQDEQRSKELQQQIEIQQQQLDQLLMQVSRWAEVVKQFADKQTHDFFYQEIPKLFGAPEEKLRSGLEEFPSGRKEGKVELWQYQWEKFTGNYDKLSQMAAEMTKSVEDLKSMPNREAALKAEHTKLDKLREETKQLKATYEDLVKHQDEYIGGKAEELINDIIHKQQIIDPKDSRSKRLEDFCKACTDRSGKSMLDIFNEQENARIERQKARALANVDKWMERSIGDD